MMGWCLADLLFIRFCIVTLGGSASRALWECRRDSLPQLRARFAHFVCRVKIVKNTNPLG